MLLFSTHIYCEGWKQGKRCCLRNHRCLYKKKTNALLLILLHILHKGCHVTSLFLGGLFISKITPDNLSQPREHQDFLPVDDALLGDAVQVVVVAAGVPVFASAKTEQ